MTDNPAEDLFLSEPAGGYGNQRQYVTKVLPAADARQEEVEETSKSILQIY